MIYSIHSSRGYTSGSQTVGRRGITGGARRAVRKTSHITKEVCVNIYVATLCDTQRSARCAVNYTRVLPILSAWSVS